MASLTAARLVVPQAGTTLQRRAVAARAALLRTKLANSAAAVSLVSVAASLGAGPLRAEELAMVAHVSSAVQAAEAAVEQVAAVVQDAAANPTLAEAVSDAEAALKLAEKTVSQASGDGGAVALAVNEAAMAMNQASAAAAGTGDVDLLAAVAAATAAIQDAAVVALEASGVDAAAVAAAAAAGTATATTVAQKVYVFLTTTEPSMLAYDALGTIAVAYLAPPLAKAGLDAARGYAGDVLPTTALDCLASDSNSTLVDIRSAALKEVAGVPDLPDNDQLFELEYASLEGSNGELRNTASVEAELTAVQIAALERASTGKVLYLMDERGTGPAREVAKQLRKRGFSKVFVIQGGCAAWATSKLSMRSWNTPAALLPLAAASKNEAGVSGGVRSRPLLG